MNEFDTRSARSRRLHLRLSVRRAAAFLVAAVALLWALTPGVRGFTLVANFSSRRAVPTAARAGIPVQEVHFVAADGTQLAGWLALNSPTAPTIILVHGFKG